MKKNPKSATYMSRQMTEAYHRLYLKNQQATEFLQQRVNIDSTVHDTETGIHSFQEE